MADMNIAGYKIHQKIYRGRFSTIFQAVETTSLGRPVTLKCVVGGIPDPEAVHRLKREHELLLRVAGSGVVEAYDFVTSEDAIALVLAEAPGQNLEKWGLFGQLDLPTLLNLGRLMARSLATVHASGVVHRDISPSNVIWDRTDGRLTLIDFDIAARLVAGSNSISATSVMQGTLAYMSPEQTGRMNRAVDTRSDLYSVGALLYELSTGVLPFDAADAMELVHAHIARAPVPPHQRKEEIPEVLSDIIMRLLSKDPEERYQTATGLAIDLNRCLDERDARGNIHPFKLGETDFSTQFRLSDRLYGRELESTSLTDALVQACSGRKSAFAVVAGGAGMGKSALVRELYQQVIDRNGHFAIGKFSAAESDTPYSSISEALSDLVLQLLGSKATRLEQWRKRILDALGGNGAVIVDMLPDLDLVIGPQPDVPTLPPVEAQNRFNHTFLRFMRALTTAEQPLVLVVDDLQWADQGSLRILELVLTDPDVTGLLVVGTYRPSEVSEWHSLTDTFQIIQRNGGLMVRLELDNLQLEDVVALVTDSFRMRPSEAGTLASLCMEKTYGNPYFLICFLESLHRQGMVQFDFEKATWSWDLASISAMDVTDNVVALISQRFGILSGPARACLQAGACLTDSFNASIISEIIDLPAEQVMGALAETMLEGLLMECSGSLPLSGSVVESRATVQTATREFRFPHDRVRQAAYELIPKKEQAALHLRIGRQLRQLLKDSNVYSVFDVVHHLNLGISLVTDPSERHDIARLNHAAGRRSKRSLAVVSGLKYVQRALELLSEDAWQVHRKIVLSLHFEAMDCCQLLRDKDGMEKYAEIIMSNAQTNVERARVMESRIALLRALNRNDEIIPVVVEAMAILGWKFPHQPKTLHVVKGLLSNNRRLKGKGVEVFRTLPPMTDVEKLAGLRVLIQGCTSVYLFEPNFIPLFVFKILEVVLQHGICPEACLGFVGYALMLIGPLHKPDEGQEYAILAEEMMERFDGTTGAAFARYLTGMFTAHWLYPVRASTPLLLTSFNERMNNGDTLQGIQLRHSIAVTTWLSGSPLDEATRVFDENLAIMREHTGDWFIDFSHFLSSLSARLQGIDPPARPRADEPVDDDTVLADWRKKGMKSVFFIYSVSLIRVSCMEGDFGRSVALCQGASTVQGITDPTYWEQEFVFLQALSFLVHGRLSEKLPHRHLRKARKAMVQLRSWHSRSPHNYRSKLLMLESELALLDKSPSKATRLCEEAAEVAAMEGFLNDAALACELLATRFEESGSSKASEAYRLQSYMAYRRWGATAISARMEELHPFLSATVNPAITRDSSLSHHTRTTTNETLGQGLDVETILKASRAVSREIVYDRLLEKMMDIVIENAGAERGCFLIRDEEDWRIAAEASVDGKRNSRMNIPLTDEEAIAQQLAPGIVNYVANSGRTIVLGNAASDVTYGSDPHVRRNNLQSVLCMALELRGQRTGIIYLENNRTTEAFTNDRVEMLRMLTAQMAISIENAKLFDYQARLISAYERFVPAEFLSFLGKKSIIHVKLGDQVEREMTVLFSDIRDFTALSESMSPQENFNFINAFLSIMEPVIRHHHGFIDKFIGDAIMALFPTNADDALRAAIEMYSELKKFNVTRATTNQKPVRIGVGLNSGRLMLGTVGGSMRMDGTVISDAVNVAARMETMTKTVGANILISEHTRQRLSDPDSFDIRYVDRLHVKGRNEPVQVYQVFLDT
jgi:predicted ATPase/class 3 adenylate cyclase